MSKKRTYEEAAAELAELPRAERFAKLIDFPTRHMFKAIGKGGGFSAALLEALDALNYQQPLLVERPSANGTYASLTFHLDVKTAADLDRIYAALEGLDGLKLLL